MSLVFVDLDIVSKLTKIVSNCRVRIKPSLSYSSTTSDQDFRIEVDLQVVKRIFSVHHP
jgi:hypothetical protein